MYNIRRTKDSKDQNNNPIVNLPPQTIQVHLLVLSKEENQLYQTILKDSMKQFVKIERDIKAGRSSSSFGELLTLYLRLLQTCVHPLLLISACKTNEVIKKALDKLIESYHPNKNEDLVEDLVDSLTNLKIDLDKVENNNLPPEKDDTKESLIQSDIQCPICLGTLQQTGNNNNKKKYSFDKSYCTML